jgi:hypothetical protein
VEQNDQVVNLSQPDGHERFWDMRTGVEMSRGEFMQKIEAGDYPGYYLIGKNGGVIPSSNPTGDQNKLD